MALPTPRRALARLTRLPAQTRHLTTTTPRLTAIQPAYILAAARTPTGSFNGSLSSLPAPQLAATAITAALARAGLPQPPKSAYIGNVLGAGIGQAPARQAVLAANLSDATEATTVNKVCASGLKAVTLAAQQIALGEEESVLAGGMENMSRVPYLFPRASQNPPFGNIQMRDALVSDGLWDVYNNIHMGACADNTARVHALSREAQDAYAIESFARAQAAWASGAFADEVAPVTVPSKKSDTVVTEDEGYTKLRRDKVASLKPAFTKDGTVTAANASSFNDGASALVVVNAALARAHGAGSRVLARIVASADAATAPIDFTVAPALAIPKALARAGIEAKDVAVWEINEAFAAVVLANAKILGLEGSMDKVNPLGGAIALGHAIGSSGSRLLTTLVHKLKVGEFGVVGICNGGGAASSMVVQRVDHV